MAVFKLLEKINNFSKVSIKIKFKSFAFKFIVSILLGFKIKPFARKYSENFLAAHISVGVIALSDLFFSNEYFLTFLFFPILVLNSWAA